MRSENFDLKRDQTGVEEVALRMAPKSQRIEGSQVRKEGVCCGLREDRLGRLGMTVLDGRRGSAYHDYPFVHDAVLHLYHMSALHL